MLLLLLLAFQPHDCKYRPLQTILKNGIPPAVIAQIPKNLYPLVMTYVPVCR